MFFFSFIANVVDYALKNTVRNHCQRVYLCFDPRCFVHQMLLTIGRAGALSAIHQLLSVIYILPQKKKRKNARYFSFSISRLSFVRRILRKSWLLSHRFRIAIFSLWSMVAWWSLLCLGRRRRCCECNIFWWKEKRGNALGLSHFVPQKAITCLHSCKA